MFSFDYLGLSKGQEYLWIMSNVLSIGFMIMLTMSEVSRAEVGGLRREGDD